MLTKDEAAGARRCLWRKSAEGVVHLAHKCPPEFGAPGDSLACLMRNPAGLLIGSHCPPRHLWWAVAADQAKGWAFHHAACSRGGARDRGVCPRRKCLMPATKVHRARRDQDRQPLARDDHDASPVHPPDDLGGVPHDHRRDFVGRLCEHALHGPEILNKVEQTIMDILRF